MTAKISEWTGKKSSLIHYAIRNKATGKYFRYPPDSVNCERWEWVTGLNKASCQVVKHTAEYVISSFQIDNAEIVECDEYESLKMGTLHFRVLR